MADNPKSLASLADDLEALAKRMQTGLPNAAADLCFRAAAALRAPTIAADDAALVAWLRNQAEGAFAFYCGKDKKAREASQMVELQIARKQLEAADLIERQGNALRAVESLESFGAMVELTTLLGPREMVTGAEVEVVSAAQLRAALAERGANDK